MMKKALVVILFFISAILALAAPNTENFQNTPENNTITLILEYGNSESFDNNNDGIDYDDSVIDFSVKNSVFNWNPNQENLCAVWEIQSSNEDTSNKVCHGGATCCNFADLAPSSESWNDDLYLHKRFQGITENYDVTAQVLSVDYSLEPENPYAEVYFSESSTLAAVFTPRVVVTKIKNFLVDKINAVTGNIIDISANFVYQNESPIPHEGINLYVNDELIGSKETDSLGNIIFNWNTSSVVPGGYLVNLSFPGRHTKSVQETAVILPSFDFTTIAIVNGQSVNGEQENGETLIGNWQLITRDTAWSIQRQDYVTKYIDYKFVYVNDSLYRVDWKWKDSFVKDILNECIILDTYRSHQCFKDNSVMRLTNGEDLLMFKQESLPRFKEELSRGCLSRDEGESFHCKKTMSEVYFDETDLNLDNFTSVYFPNHDLVNLQNDIILLKNSEMPKEVLKGRANIVGDVADLNKNSGSFYIQMNDGFWNSNGLKLKWGLHSTIVEFNNTKTIENLTFTANNTLTRYLRLPKNAIVSVANMSIKGRYHVHENDTEISYSCEGTFDSQPFGACTQAVDEAWDGQGAQCQYQSAQTCRVFENISIIDSSSLNWTFQTYIISSSDSIDVSYWDYSASSWSSAYSSNSPESVRTNHNVVLPSNSYSQSPIRIRTSISYNSGVYQSEYVEGKLLGYGFPNNPYVEAGNRDYIYEWNYSGTFTQATNLSDFSDSLNQALNNSQCNCSGCSLEGEYCVVPVLFHSDTVGILEYSGISIEHNSPPLFTINTTDDSNETHPTNRSAYVTFTANITDFDNDSRRLIICDDSGRTGVQCVETLYCDSNLTSQSQISCQFNTTNLTGVAYNWTSFGCDNNSACTSGVNGTFYIARPRNPKMYVNGSLVWNVSGLFNGPVTVENFSDELQNEVDSCTPINDSCNISLTFSSDAEGKLELSLLNIQYALYDKEPPVIHGVDIQPDPVLRNTTMNITVNATDNANVTHVSAMHKEASTNLTQDSSTGLWEGSMTSPSTFGPYQLNITSVDSSNLTTLFASPTTSGGESNGSYCSGQHCTSGGPSSSPELLIPLSNIQTVPTTIEENETVEINVTIHNVGEGDANNPKIEMKVDGTHTTYNTVTISGYDSEVTQFLWNATAGNHTLTFIADYDEQLEEEDETNNDASINLSIIDITPPSVLSIFTERGSLIVKLNISDNLDISSVAAIVNTTTLSFGFNATSGLWEGFSEEINPGTYPITIIVIDSSGLTTTVTSTVTVYEETIDITLNNADLLFSNPTPSDGENLTISVIVHNQGINDTANFTVALLVDGVTHANNSLSVPADANATTQFTWLATYSNHTITADIDSTGSIPEFDETNNQLNKTLFVEDGQAPTINEITFPEILYHNLNFSIIANVTDNINVSHVTAFLGSANSSLGYNVSSQIYQGHLVQPQGTYILTIVANDTSGLETTSEINLRIYGTDPDLTILTSGMQFLSNVTENENASINVTLHNLGGTAANTFRVEFLVDNVSQSNQTASVSAASTKVVIFTWNAVYGNHELRIDSDGDNTVSESNESNNDKTRTIFVADVTAPTAPQLSSNPANWTNETTFNISWAPATDPNGIQHYEYQIDGRDWVTIGNTTHFITASQTEGIHSVLVRATDQPGNTGDSSNISVYVDQSSPNAPTIHEWHMGGNWTGHNTPFLSWEDPGDTGSGVTGFVVSLNGTEEDISYNTSYHSSNLTTGIYIFKVRSYDALNHSSSGSNNVTAYIDTTLPNTASIVSTTHADNTTWYASSTAVFSVTLADEDSDIRGYYYQFDRAANSTPSIRSFWETNTTLNISSVGGMSGSNSNSTNETQNGIPTGIWYLHIVAQDNVGNLEDQSAHYTIQVDRSAPTITGRSPENGTNVTNGFEQILVNYSDFGSGVNTSSILLTLDGEDVTFNATINASSLSFTPSAYYALGQHNVTLYITDNLGNQMNASWVFVKTDGEPPTYSGIVSSPAEPVTYVSGQQYTFNSTWTDTTGVYTIKIAFNWINITVTGNGTYAYLVSDLSAGTHTYSWWANDSLGYGNQTPLFNYTISKATPQGSLTVNNSLNMTYGTVVSIGFNEPNQGDADVTYDLYRDGVFVGAGETVSLAAGNHTYLLNTTGGQNYSSTSLMDQQTLTVEKAPSSVHAYLGGNRSNTTTEKDTSIYLNGTLVIGEAIIELYLNGTLINSGNPPVSNLTLFDEIGLFNITAVYPESQNYTSSSETWFVNVVKDPVIQSASISPANQGYGTNVSLVANVTDLRGTADIQQVIAEVTTPLGSKENLSMTYLQGDLWQANYLNFKNGTYNLTVYANDSRGSRDTLGGLSFVLTSHLNVSVQTAKQIYNRNETVQLDAASVIKNSLMTNASGELLMKVEYWNGSGWLLQDIVLNDTATRRVQANGLLNLGQIWNGTGGWPSSANSFGLGLYRAWIAMTDPLDELLLNDDLTEVAGASNFTICHDVNIDSFTEVSNSSAKRVWRMIVTNDENETLTNLNWNITGWNPAFSSQIPFNLTPNESITLMFNVSSGQENATIAGSISSICVADIKTLERSQ